MGLFGKKFPAKESAVEILEHLNEAVYLTLEDDSVLECLIVKWFMWNDHSYGVLLPTNTEDGTAFLFYMEKDPKDGMPLISEIEDTTEYEKAGEVFDYLMEMDEFDYKE